MDEEIKEVESQEGPKGGSPIASRLPEKSVDKMTVKELREIAGAIPGLQGVTAMKKEQLLEVVRKHLGIEDQTPVRKAKVKKPAASVKELKSKLSELGALKKEAREAKDRHRIDILRRRINRLKKMTRKASHA
jgi:cell division protein FtsX